MARLVLWDVDGTLVNTRGIGSAVFDRALEQVLGLAPSSRIALSGKTDPQIAREYLELMTVDDLDRRLPLVIEAVEAQVAAAATMLAETGEALAGVPELLARVATTEGVHQTLLTGNTMANAVVKVTAFGLQEWLDLDVGAYGSDHADRRQLVPIARERVRRLRGAEAGPDDTWVVGDTPNDLACARAGGVHCLLVATGRFEIDELAALAPDAVLADLSDTETVMTLLLGRSAE